MSSFTMAVVGMLVFGFGASEQPYGPGREAMTQAAMVLGLIAALRLAEKRD